MATSLEYPQYHCETKKLPFIVLERNEIHLSIVQPGEGFRQSIVYALCPAAPSISSPKQEQLTKKRLWTKHRPD